MILIIILNSDDPLEEITPQFDPCTMKLCVTSPHQCPELSISPDRLQRQLTSPEFLRTQPQSLVAGPKRTSWACLDARTRVFPVGSICDRFDLLADKGCHGHLAVAHNELAFSSRLVDHLHQLITGDLFLLHQSLCQGVQEVHVVPQQLHAALVLFVHDALHLRIHRLLQSLGYWWRTPTHKITPHERPTLLLSSQEALANLRRHPKLHHHRLGHLRALLEVVGGTCGDIVSTIDDLLCEATTQCHTHSILQELLGVEA
mmetsp:Transcript_80783/g.193754  ORF Transcript_80783/g.193754 Transcript_80783/m.193754 type:complete len:259 (-) Transcript_80783:1990-2766(-)